MQNRSRGGGWSPIQISPRIYSAQEGVKLLADEMTVASIISNGRNLECDFGEKETCEKHKASWFSPPGCGPCLEKMEGINEKPGTVPPACMSGLHIFKLYPSCSLTRCPLLLSGVKVLGPGGSEPPDGHSMPPFVGMGGIILLFHLLFGWSPSRGLPAGEHPSCATSRPCAGD